MTLPERVTTCLAGESMSGESLAGVTRQAEISQTFLPDAEVDDVLDVAGDDGHL